MGTVRNIAIIGDDTAGVKAALQALIEKTIPHEMVFMPLPPAHGRSGGYCVGFNSPGGSIPSSDFATSKRMQEMAQAMQEMAASTETAAEICLELGSIGDHIGYTDLKPKRIHPKHLHSNKYKRKHY